MAPVRTLTLLVVLLLGGCAVQPMTPKVEFMPAVDKPTAAFEEDRAMCRDFVEQQIARDDLNRRSPKSPILKAVLGAMSGPAGGGSAGRVSQSDNLGPQLRYAIAYTQCMRARGNLVALADSAAPAATNRN